VLRASSSQRCASSPSQRCAAVARVLLGKDDDWSLMRANKKIPFYIPTFRAKEGFLKITFYQTIKKPNSVCFLTSIARIFLFFILKNLNIKKQS
jgi:hypothetical protein